MAGIKTLVGLAFLGSVGMTFLIIACATNSNWILLINILFYILCPIPILISRRYIINGLNSGSGSSNPCNEMAIFITVGIIISSYALVIILSRHPSQQPIIPLTSAWLTVIGNTIIFTTIFSFFKLFDNEELNNEYSMW